MSLTRRQFLWSAAATAALGTPKLNEPWIAAGRAQISLDGAAGRFRHGVASGDPLADRVILWTRVTPADEAGVRGIEVGWRIASDEDLSQVVAQGTARTNNDRDFTVKVDVGGLQPGRP